VMFHVKWVCWPVHKNHTCTQCQKNVIYLN